MHTMSFLRCGQDKGMYSWTPGGMYAAISYHIISLSHSRLGRGGGLNSYENYISVPVLRIQWYYIFVG